LRRLGALRLLTLLLTLLRLLDLRATPPPHRLGGKGRGRTEGRHRNCADDKLPLHIAEVTPPAMNGK
jgi:hypothetical protein